MYNIEIWKDIVGYEGLYKISNQGKVLSVKRNIVLKYRLNYKKGYPVINLCKNSKLKTAYIHRLVAEYFIENPNNLKYVNHINNDKEKNNVNNLEWCTGSDNMLKSYQNGSNSKHKTKVEQFDLISNETIKIWDSAHQAYHSGFKAIYDILYQRKGRKSSGGYGWRYVFD